MPTTEQGGSGTAMSARREIVGFLSAWQRIWHAAFPGLHRRALPQIVTHLATRARAGAAVGELHGLVKQIFLLDDSTVKERILDLGRLGLCRFDPPHETLSTRSVVIPTVDLLDRFDRHLLALGAQLLATAAAIDPAVPRAGPVLAPDSRVLRAVDLYAEPWRAALERIFAAPALSPARRVEAIRHLNATSHWTLLHMAIEHRYGVSALTDGQDGLLADRMAAALLTLTGQNFQTSRDHIAYLLEVGLLARQPGRALRVALAEPAAPHFDTALAAAAAALPALALSLVEPVAAAEPAELRTMRKAPALELRHELAVAMPGAALRLVPIGRTALTIGRLAPCDLLLPGADVSRQHCRLELAGQELRLTDLNSTNGTIVDGERIVATVTLRPGAVVRIGASVLTYTCHVLPEAPPAADAEDTEDAERTLHRPAIVNKSGISAD